MSLGPQTISIGPSAIGGGSSSNSAKREIIFTGRSTAVDQQPSAVDTPLQVEFGTAQGGVNTPLQMDATGSITVNESGTYYLIITLQTGRLGASGISMIYGRLLVDGVQFGGSVSSELDDANIIIPLQFNVVNDFTAGQVITIEIYRDSGGDNSGGLIQSTPTLSGWSNAETATVTASRLIPASQSASTPVQDRSNYVLVKQKSDFPAPVGGVITLASNTDYELNGIINLLGDRIEATGSNVVFGQNPRLDGLRTDNASALVTGSDDSLIVRSMNFQNVSGPIFDFKNTAGNEGTNNFFAEACVITGGTSFGTFENLLLVSIEKCAFQSLSNGLTFSGSLNEAVRLDGNILEDTFTGTAVNLGAAVFGAISIDHNFIQDTAPIVLIAGQSNSANIRANGQGSVVSNISFGGNNPQITGINPSDLRWLFTSNNTVVDSVNTGSILFNGNATNTVIASAGTDVKVAGTTSNGTLSRFDSPSSNTLRYIGIKDVNCSVSVMATCQVVGFLSSTEIRFRVYVNGSPVTGGEVTTTSESGSLVSATISTSEILSTNDEIEVYVANLDGTQNLLITDLTVSARG